jgi:HPt (histidine-containing phosphotransfer) domain-containing protein
MDSAAQPSMDEALDRMWARFLPQIEERLVAVETAAACVAGGSLTADQLSQAHAAAHKLAGVLGTFGLARGTALARELEVLYAGHNGPGLPLSAQLTDLSAQLRAVVESRGDAGTVSSSYTLKK